MQAASGQQFTILAEKTHRIFMPIDQRTKVEKKNEVNVRKSAADPWSFSVLNTKDQ